MRNLKLFIGFLILSFSALIFLNVKGADDVFLEVTFDGNTTEYTEAEYNNLSFDTLFNESSADKEIVFKLYNSINANFKLQSTNNVAFDLNGNTITGESTDCVFDIVSGASLRIYSDIDGAIIKNKYNSDSDKINELIKNEGDFISTNIKYEMAYDAKLAELSNVIFNNGYMSLINCNASDNIYYTAISNTGSLSLNNTTINSNKIGVQNANSLKLIGNTYIKNNKDNNLILNSSSILDFSDGEFSGEATFLSQIDGCLTKKYEDNMKGILTSDTSISGYCYNGELYYYSNDFNVTFYDNLESNSKVETSISFGGNEFNDTIKFSNPGYYLQGYATTASGDTFVVDSFNAPFKSIDGYTDQYGKWINTNNVSLYAIWNESGYTLVIHSEDDIYNVIVSFSDKMILGLSLESEAYNFMGLYSDENYIEQICDTDYKFIPSTSYTNESGEWTYLGSASLYAKWEPKTYNVTITDDDASNIYNIKYNETALNNFTGYSKTGYAFKGFVNSDNVLVFDSEGNLLPNIENISDGNGKWISTSDIELSPLFEAKSYKLEDLTNDLEFYVEMGDSSISDFIKPTKANYEFVGLAYNDTLLVNPDGTFVKSIDSITDSDGKWIYDGSISVSAQFERIILNISIDYKNGSSYEFSINSGDYLPELATAPTKDGFIIVGIYDENGTEYYDKNLVRHEIEITSNLALYLLWGIEYDGLLYTISLNENDINKSGNYYLSDDLEVSSAFIISSGYEVNVLFNGHVLTGTESTLFKVENGATLVLISGDNTLTHEILDTTYHGGVITGGKGLNINGNTYGGAIYSLGNLTINDINFVNNSADNGIIVAKNALDINGAIIDNNSATNSILDVENAGNIDNLSLINNEAKYGIYNGGELVITNSIFNNNSISSSIIYNENTLNISNSEIKNNSSTETTNGALIYNVFEMTAAYLEIDNNNYSYSSGLIYNLGTMTINNSSVTNSNLVCGSIINAGLLITINNSEIKANKAQTASAIKNNKNAQILLNNVTIEDNEATNDESIYNAGIIRLNNKIIISDNLYTVSNGIIFESITDESKIIISLPSEGSLTEICEVSDLFSGDYRTILESYDDNYRIYVLENVIYLLDVSLEKIYKISYNSTADGYEINGFTDEYLANDENLAIDIPDEYNDGINGEKNILIIGENAFYNLGIEGALILPANINQIGKNAFVNNSLSTIYLPNLNTTDIYADGLPFDSTAIIIAKNVSDYYFMKTLYDSNYLTYALDVTLDPNGGKVEAESINKLFGFDYHYVKKDNSEWYYDSEYNLPLANYENYNFIGYNTNEIGTGAHIEKISTNKYYAIYDRIMTNLKISVVGDEDILVTDTLDSTKWSSLVKVEIEYLDGNDSTETEDYAINGEIKAGLCTFEFVLNIDNNIKGSLDLQVIDSSITKIEIKQNPNKLEYNAFEEFDPTGMILNIYRGEEVEEATNFSCEYRDGDSLKNNGELKDIVTIVYSSLTLTLEVKVNKISYQLPDDLFIDTEFEYDGSVHYLVANNLPDDLIATYKNNSLKYAGNKVATISLELVDKLNYLEISDITATITIVPRTLELVWEEKNALVYNQKEKTVTVEAGNLIEGDSCNISIKLIEGASNVYAGSFKYTAYEISNPNYKLPSNTLSPEYVINKALAMVSWSNLTVTYNGEIQKPTINIYGLYNGDSCEAIYDGYKDAGEYTVAISELSNSNYYITMMENTFVIEKASYYDLNLTFSNIHVIYDGLEHTAQINGNMPSDIKVTYSNNTLTDVGEITATASFEVNSNNYEEFKDVKCTITIIKLYLDKPIADDRSYTYNGNAIIYSLAESEFYTIENNVQTNAGAYIVTVKINNPDNASWLEDDDSDLEYEFVIKKASYDLNIVFESTSFDYDGQEHVLEIEGDLPEGLTVSYENNKITNVGSQIAKAIFTNSNPNYNEVATISVVISVIEAFSKNEVTTAEGDVKVVIKGENDVYYLLVNANSSVTISNNVLSKFNLLKTYKLYLQNGDEIVNTGDFQIEINYELEEDVIFVEILADGSYKNIDYESSNGKIIFNTTSLGSYAILKTKPSNRIMLAQISTAITALIFATAITYFFINKRYKNGIKL